MASSTRATSRPDPDDCTCPGRRKKVHRIDCPAAPAHWSTKFLSDYCFNELVIVAPSGRERVMQQLHEQCPPTAICDCPLHKQDDPIRTEVRGKPITKRKMQKVK
jgi:hypothetical protein